MLLLARAGARRAPNPKSRHGLGGHGKLEKKW